MASNPPATMPTLVAANGVASRGVPSAKQAISNMTQVARNQRLAVKKMRMGGAWEGGVSVGHRQEVPRHDGKIGRGRHYRIASDAAVQSRLQGDGSIIAEGPGEEQDHWPAARPSTSGVFVEIAAIRQVA